MIASCGVLDNELRQFSREEGVTFADSVKTLGVDLKRLGAKEKALRKKSLVKKNKAFQKNYMKAGVKKLLRAGVVPARTWRAAVGMFPTERLKLRRQMAWKWEKSFPPWPLSIGQKECGLESGGGANKEEVWMRQNSRSSEVETGERTCRSSDV